MFSLKLYCYELPRQSLATGGFEIIRSANKAKEQDYIRNPIVYRYEYPINT